MVNKTAIVALALLAIVDSGLSSSCLTPCWLRQCGPPPTTCSSYEVIKDTCGCCDVCAKGLGESCGGAWGQNGTCSKRLECQLDQDKPGSDDHKDGTCVNKIPIDPCATSPEAVCSPISFCGSDGLTYNTTCTFIEARCRNPKLTRSYCVNLGIPRGNLSKSGDVNPIQDRLGVDQENITREDRDPQHPGPNSGPPESIIPNTKPDPCATVPGEVCTEVEICGSDGHIYYTNCAFIEARCRNPKLTRSWYRYCLR